MTKKSFAALYAKVEATPAYQAEKVAVAFLAELNVHLQAHKVTNAELARRMGVSPAYITKIFRGPSNLSIETLTKLADALGCRVHVHLANHAADVRWFDVMQAPRTFQREIDPGAAQFVKVMEQLKPINQDAFNDSKFAFAA
jgi:transcriptional regulator with XRE-family HTH domain